MAKTLLAEIVTPEGILYANEVEMVIAPTTTGEVGILPLHEPIVSELAAGDVRLKTGPEVGDWEWFAVYEGYVQVHEDKVIILANRATSVSNIDVDRAREAITHIEAELAALPPEASDQRNAAQEDIKWYEVQISRAEKRRHAS